MKNTRFSHIILTVVFCVSMIAFGWVYLVYGTTIGANVSTVDGTLTGTLTVSGESNLDTLIFGGSVTLLSGTVTHTITAAQLCDSSVIRMSPTVAAASTTFPGTTTLFADCLTANGDSKIVLFENSAAGASSTYLVEGSGTRFMAASSTVAAGLQINASSSVMLYIVRYDVNRYTVTVDELFDAQ